MAPESPLVSIIIPNWNGAHHLPACLQSLRHQTYAPLETLVVDNGSSDGSVALVEARFPEARAVALGENHGFAGACNVGMRTARGLFLVLLNNDTEADPHWIRRSSAAFERHPEAGWSPRKCCCSISATASTPPAISTGWTACRATAACGSRTRDSTMPRGVRLQRVRRHAAYRREHAGPRSGMLDEDFFFSCEDVDLAWRAQLAGWRCVYAPQRGQSTTNSRDRRRHHRQLLRRPQRDLRCWSRTIPATCGASHWQDSARATAHRVRTPCAPGEARPPGRACAAARGLAGAAQDAPQTALAYNVAERRPCVPRECPDEVDESP